MSKAPDFLKAALSHMEDRAATYDKPEGERSMPKVVAAFNAITEHKLTAEQGWLFAVLLKAVRAQQGAYRADNYEDGSAYFALMGEQAAGDRVPLNLPPQGGTFETGPVTFGGQVPTHPRPDAATHWHAHYGRWVAEGTESGYSEWMRGAWFSVKPEAVTARWLEGLRPLTNIPAPPPDNGAVTSLTATHRDGGGILYKVDVDSGRWLRWGNQTWFFASDHPTAVPPGLRELKKEVPLGCCARPGCTTTNGCYSPYCDRHEPDL